MDELIRQALAIRGEYEFTDCEVGLATWGTMTEAHPNARSLLFFGLNIRPSMRVLEGRIWPAERIKHE